MANSDVMLKTRGHSRAPITHVLPSSIAAGSSRGGPSYCRTTRHPIFEPPRLSACVRVCLRLPEQKRMLARQGSGRGASKPAA